MKFLESLYSNDNFGIYLFAIIALFVILFFVILFFGKKDEKKSKNPKLETTEEFAEPTVLEPVSVVDSNINNTVEEQPSVLPTSEPLFQEIPTAQPLNIPVQPEQTIVEEPMKFSNVVLNADLTKQEEPIKEEIISEPIPPEEKEFDFDALSEAISKELESIDKSVIPTSSEPISKPVELKPVIEEPTSTFPIFEPIKPDKMPEIKEEPIKTETPKAKPVMPTVFSSVYVNREAEKKEPDKKEPVAPVIPQFELPKMADLPKKIETKEEQPKETFPINNVLDNIEDETYDI